MAERDASGAAPSSRRRRISLLGLVARVGLVAVLVAGVLLLQAEASYRVTAGSVSFQLQPSWPGGRLVMPLGPAGELSLKTHRTPVDVIMGYRLPAETTGLITDEGVVADLPRVESGARAAFLRFLAGKVPWLALIGVAGGLLVAGRWTRHRVVWGAVLGVTATLVLGGGVAAVSYATLDRSPSAEYRGLATKVPAVLPLLQALSTGGDQSDNLSRLQDFLDGLEAVATQLTVAPRQPVRTDVVRLLLASDFHDNVFGARVAARLAASGDEPVDAVLLAGDITDRGTAEEARLFVRVFGRPEAPVIVVGGNHDDAPAMRVFARAGYVIPDETVVTVSGVNILGASDPVAFTSRIESDLGGLAAAGGSLVATWAGARPEPQVLLVHDVRQADQTIAEAEAQESPLVVAYGNDHVGAVRRSGSVVLVDAGTAGASGYEAIGSASPPPPGREPPSHGRDVYTFQLIDFSRGSEPYLVGVTTLSYAGDGRTVVSYSPFAVKP